MGLALLRHPNNLLFHSSTNLTSLKRILFPNSPWCLPTKLSWSFENLGDVPKIPLADEGHGGTCKEPYT